MLMANSSFEYATAPPACASFASGVKHPALSYLVNETARHGAVRLESAKGSAAKRY